MTKKKGGASFRPESSLLRKLDFMAFLDAMTMGVLFMDQARRIITVRRQSLWDISAKS
jgi:hypothetical protein